MHHGKTLLELAQRDVAKAELRFARQTALVEQLQAQGCDTTDAEAALNSLKALLRFLREDLEYLKTQAGSAYQH